MNITFSFSTPILPEPTSVSELVRNLYHVIRDPVKTHLGARCEVLSGAMIRTEPQEMVSKIEAVFDRTVRQETSALELIHLKAGLYILDRFLAYDHVFESVHTLPEVYVFGPLLAKIDAVYQNIYPGKEVVDALDEHYPQPTSMEGAVAFGVKAQRILTYLSLQKVFVPRFIEANHSAHLNFFTQEFLKASSLEKSQVSDEVMMFRHSFDSALDIDPAFMLLISPIFNIKNRRGGLQTLTIDVIRLTETQIRPMIRLVREKIPTATGTSKDLYEHLLLLLTNEQASTQFEELTREENTPSSKAKKQYQLVSRNDKRTEDPLENLLVIGAICKVEETFKSVLASVPGSDIDMRYHLPQEQRIQQYYALLPAYERIYRHFYSRIFDQSFLANAGSSTLNKKKLLSFRLALGMDSTHHLSPDNFAGKKREVVSIPPSVKTEDVVASSKTKEKKKKADPFPIEKVEELIPEEHVPEEHIPEEQVRASSSDTFSFDSTSYEDAVIIVPATKETLLPPKPSYADIVKIPKAIEPAAVPLIQDPAKIELALTSFKSTMLYSDRVQAWFDDPDSILSTDPAYVGKPPKDQHEALLFHTFPKAVDDFLDAYGIKSTWKGKSGKETPHVCIPGELVLENGKTITGLFTYAFDPVTKVCYHRCFTRKTGHDLVREWVEKRHWTVAFPTLETANQASKKPQTLISEDKGYRYRFVTPYVLEIDFPEGKMKVRLFQSEIK